jgi:hypothetical protein
MLNNIAAITNSGAPPQVGDYESIATVTVGGGGQSTITFSSIPATYSHLQIRGIARDSRATYVNSNLIITFNGDTGANYSWHNLQGNGGATAGRAGANQNSIRSNVLASAGAPTGAFAGYVTDILDYANTNKNKTLRSLGGVDTNGAVMGEGGFIELLSGNWRSTSAITSITLAADTPNLLQYSSFALYGIK